MAEGWARLKYAEMPPPVRPREIQLPRELIQPDPTLGYHFRPNAENFFVSPHGEFKVNYQINEFGLHDSGMISTFGRAPIVIALGDAFGEGWGIMPEVTFTRELQRQLRQLDGVDQLTRILNAGMTGYGAAQCYLLGQRLLDKLDGDVLLFVYTSVMPVADHRFLANAEVDANGIAIRAKQPSTKYQNATGKPKSLLERSILYQLAHAYIDAKRAREAYIPGDPDSDLFAAARGSRETISKLHQRSLAHVAALADIAKSRNVEFVRMHVPLPHQVAADEWLEGRAGQEFEARTYDAPEVEIITEFCRARSMNCIMSTPMLRDLAAQRSSRVYFRYDYTLTAVGHRAMVEFLLDPIKSALDGWSANTTN